MRRKGGVSAAGGGIGAGEDGGSRGRELHHGGERLERRQGQGAGGGLEVGILCLRLGEGALSRRIGAEGPQPYGGGAAFSGYGDTV